MYLREKEGRKQVSDREKKIPNLDKKVGKIQSIINSFLLKERKKERNVHIR